MPVDFTTFCTCLRCDGELVRAPAGLRCRRCSAEYEIRDGVLMLLPHYDDELRERYASSYQEVARADLDEPFEHNRSARHEVLRRFIGHTDGERVLDVGSSAAGYLREMAGETKVALDLALPFLQAIPPDSGILRVCSDAELLPVKPGYFDTIIVSDVLEHLLEPERLMERLKRVCRTDTRLIIHIPWKEDLAKYAKSEYEFTHLRSFGEYDFATLWRYFSVVRRRPTYPMLEEPIIFQLSRFLPPRVYDRLVDSYFHGGLIHREYAWRERWIAELPRRERWLLRFYPGAFMMFELRIRPRAAASDAVRDRPLHRRLRNLRRARLR